MATKTIDAMGAQAVGDFWFQPLSDNVFLVINKNAGSVTAASDVSTGFTILNTQIGQDNVVGQPDPFTPSTWRDTFLENAITY